MKTYIVFCNEREFTRTKAVSPQKAINNARYRMCQQVGGWFNVPSKDKWDAVEE